MNDDDLFSNDTGSAIVGMYGSVQLVRAKCPDCKRRAFVIDGVMQCCDLQVGFVFPTKTKRMCDVEAARRLPPIRERRAVLDAQGGACLYCGLDVTGYGSNIDKRGRRVYLKIHWDHMVPFSYSLNNSTDNYAAACHVCNFTKGSRMYQTIDQARADLQLRRERAGWQK